MIVGILEKYLKKTNFNLNKEQREQGIAFMIEEDTPLDLEDPEVWNSMYEDPYADEEDLDDSKNDEGGPQV